MCVHKSLSVKHFHAVLTRNAHECLLKSSFGKASIDLQRDALLKAGVGARDIYTDKVTGVKSDRPGLKQALSHVRDGDTFVVWRLDRLGRSLRHLIDTVTTLKNQGVSFKSLTENIDTSTATGNLVFQIFGALAEFERNLITERTVAGLEAARIRGRKGGRPRFNPSSRSVNYAKHLYNAWCELLKCRH